MVTLDGVKIHTPVTRVQVGATIPLLVVGTSNNQVLTPLSFGSATPGLLFTWEVENPSVLQIDSVHKHVSFRAFIFNKYLIDIISELGFTDSRSRMTQEQ